MSTQTDKIASTLAQTEKTLGDFETKFSGLAREVRTAREEFATAQEERRRISAQWDYEEEQRRRSVTDQQKLEDVLREQKHNERTQLLDRRETAVRIALGDLLGVNVAVFDRDGEKAIAAALAKKIEESRADAEKAATSAAAAKYAIEKRIDKADAEKETALLKAANERLTLDLTTANARADRLQTQYDALAARMGDLSRDAFNAAGGITGKANSALEAAASAPAGLRR